MTRALLLQGQAETVSDSVHSTMYVHVRMRTCIVQQSWILSSYIAMRSSLTAPPEWWIFCQKFSNVILIIERRGEGKVLLERHFV